MTHLPNTLCLATAASRATSRPVLVRAAWLFCLCMGIAGCAAVPATSSRESVQTEVQAFLERWNNAMAVQDRAAIRAAYSSSDQFQWFEDGKLRYSSADAVLAALNQFPPGSKLQTRLSNVTSRALSDRLVHASADFQTKVTMPVGNFEFSGVFTMVLERTEAGWVFVNGHTSTLRPASGRQ